MSHNTLNFHIGLSAQEVSSPTVSRHHFVHNRPVSVECFSYHFDWCASHDFRPNAHGSSDSFRPFVAEFESPPLVKNGVGDAIVARSYRHAPYIRLRGARRSLVFPIDFRPILQILTAHHSTCHYRIEILRSFENLTHESEYLAHCFE